MQFAGLSQDHRAALAQASLLLRKGEGGGAGALLHVGVDESIIVTGNGAALETFVLAGCGVEALARQWGRSWPGPEQLEQAIAEVEDSIMATPAEPAHGATLLCQGEFAGQLLHMAGQISDRSPNQILSRARIELWFGDLAAAIEGSVVARRGLPETSIFAAGLLVLRECMHHLDYGTLLALP